MQKRQLGLTVLFLGLVISFVAVATHWDVIAILAGKSRSNQAVSVWVEGMPYSSDPLEYDAFSHHVIFRSVFSSLVTEYRQGQFTGLIAESWDTSKDFRIWKFKLRKNLRYGNGDPITPERVLKSLKRIAFVLRARKSQSGLFENLDGFEQFVDINSAWSGLELDSDLNLIFRFKRPFEKALETIGFGLYAIVHPSQFNDKNGEWIDKKQSISSGPFLISSWTKEKIILERRQFIDEFENAKSINSILISWSESDRGSQDILMGTSDETSLKKTHDFFGGAVSEIGYVQCMSWSDPSSPCHVLQARQTLRKSFYASMQSKGLQITHSFFPLVMKGVKEPDLDPNEEGFKLSGVIRIRPTAFSNPAFAIGYDSSMRSASTETGLTFKQVELSREKLSEESRPDLKHYSVDLAARGTGILVVDPDDDIRFMFLSKEGIKLPDVDGRILKALAQRPLDPQEVNQLMWEQAVIWPVVHYASGLWCKHGEFDLSQVNLILPPTEFQWIRRN